jgi:hypothetical protein
MKTPREVGRIEIGDTLWLVTPFWDEGDDYEPAEGTDSLVVARSEGEAREFAINGAGREQFGCPGWVTVRRVNLPAEGRK